MKKKGYIFGTGGIGLKAKDKLEEEGNAIIGFLDNDSFKWGKSIENCLVYDPQYIENVSYDFIAIGVYKAADVIKEQLLRMGVSESKIIVPIRPVRIFPNPAPVSEEQLEFLDDAEYESETTRNYIQKKIIIDDGEFLKKLEKLKQTLKDNLIPREKVCVVGGAVLQAYGLRRSKKFDDIDIIMTSDLRKIYGTGLVIVSETAEMHPQNEYTVSDDEIIGNKKYHFIFRDLKFACLEIQKPLQQ